MELKDAILTLRGYNKWRRGEDESLPMPNPTEVGMAIETVCDALAQARLTIKRDVVDVLQAVGSRGALVKEYRGIKVAAAEALKNCRVLIEEAAK